MSTSDDALWSSRSERIDREAITPVTGFQTFGASKTHGTKHEAAELLEMPLSSDRSSRKEKGLMSLQGSFYHGEDKVDRSEETDKKSVEHALTTSGAHGPAHLAQVSLDDWDLEDEQAVCSRLLCEGYVNSYVEFYKLAMTLNETMDKGVHESVLQSLGAEKVRFICSTLIEAEHGERMHQPMVSHQSFQTLASFFKESGQNEAALQFCAKQVELARLSRDVQEQLKASLTVGSVLFNMGKFNEAEVYLEYYQKVTDKFSLEEEAAKGKDILAALYKERARECEESSNFEEALLYHQRRDEVLHGGNEKSRTRQYLELGYALLNTGDHKKAIEFFEDALKKSTEREDLVAQAEAHCAMGHVHEAVNNVEEALQHYLNFHKTAEKTGEIAMKIKTSRKLADVYMTLGKHAKAVEFLEMNFSLLNSSSLPEQRRMLEDTKIKIGLAKSYLLYDGYVRAVESDIGSLLGWKLRGEAIASSS